MKVNLILYLYMFIYYIRIFIIILILYLIMITMLRYSTIFEVQCKISCTHITVLCIINMVIIEDGVNSVHSLTNRYME